jgi:hypothetical protein
MPSQFLVLNEAEIEILLKPVRGQGGFQNLMRRLQNQYRHGTQELRLEDEDIEDIQRYAFDYEQGGWEDDLKAMLARHLGPTLGRGA